MSATATVRPARVPEVHPATPSPAAPDHRVLLLTLAFFLAGAIGVWFHEMWQDEWQAWMIARDSGSLREVLGHVRAEGHPPGWYLPLFLLSRFTRDPVAMQVLNLLVATAAVYLLARFSPLSWIQRVLIAFSYFLAYEYTVIARSYMLGVLALFTFCILYTVRHRHPLAPRAALLLLAGTSPFGFMLAFTMYGMLLLEDATRSGPRRAWDGSRIGAAVALVGWVAAIALAALWMSTREGGGWGWPGADGPRLTKWAAAVSTLKIVEAYLPIPRLSSMHIWNTHVLTTPSTAALGLAVLGALLLAGSAVSLLLRRPLVLFLYLAGTGLLLAFRHFIFIGEMRHTGHLFLLLVACLWLAALPGPTARFRPAVDRWVARAQRAGGAVIMGVLIVQVAVALGFYAVDMRKPFSTAPQVAAYIQQAGLGSLPVMVNPDGAGSSIAGTLDRPVYYFYNRKQGTFINYQRYQHKDPTWANIGRLLNEAGDDVLLVLGDELVKRRFSVADPPAGISIRRLVSFPPAIQSSESYTVYRIQRSPAGAAPAAAVAP